MKSGVALLICALLVALWLVSFDGTGSNEPISKPAVPTAPVSKPTAISPAPVTRASASTPTSARSTVVTTVPSNEEPAPIAEYDLDQAMAMMRQSVAQGDPRQPELAPRVADAPPSATELTDPQRYAESEARHARAAIAAYAQILRQLPALRARVAQAQTDPSRSAEDYRQAKEALEQLEQMRERLVREQPGLLP